MTVSPISSNSYIQNLASSGVIPTSGANVRDAVKRLGQALQSGDLQGAQQAYATIQSAWSARLNDAQTSQNTQSTTGSNSTVQDAFKALGQALQSGDLQGAQQAFSTLRSTYAARRGHHHHHASGADPDKGTSNSAGSSSSNTGTNGVTARSPLLTALEQSGSSGNGGTDANTLFSSLLQQLAAGTSGANGIANAGTLLNALLQQSTGASGSSTNQSTFSIVT